MEQLVLDRGIRTFVLIPIAFVVIAMSFIRMRLLALLKTDQKVVMKDLKNSSTMARSSRLLGGRNILSASAWSSRVAWFIKKDTGVLWKAPPAKDPMAALGGGGDPGAAAGMMKNQMVFIFLQGLLAYWPMMQRGVEVSGLDVSYISSLSWYFIVMFCSSGFMQMVMSWKSNGPIDPNASTEAMMQNMMPMGGGGPMGGGPDHAKMFEDAKNSLTIAQRNWFLNEAEQNLLTMWKSGSQYIKA